MILSNIAGQAAPRASRSDYIRDWLAGLDDAALQSDAGEPIAPDSALRVAVVHRGINVLAHAIAAPPLNVYERLPDGKRAADQHPSYQLLHRQPNAWMTSFRWRHLTMVRALLNGESFNELLPGPRGISQLIPLEPSTTRAVEQLGSGKLLYVTRDRTQYGYAPERRISQDNMLHVRGLSVDGKRGVPLVEVARNAIGLSLAAEKHGSMFLRNGARFAGLLKTAGELDDDVRKENEASWQRAYGGTNASGLVPVLSGGLEYQAISANNRDSQWLEARTFQVEELLRFLGVPGVLVGYTDKTSTYASAEQFFLSFVKNSVAPWAENIAAELNFSVVMDSETFFAEFDLDGLLKGDIQTRYQAHQQAILSGWKNRNEVRREENYNPGPPELDEFLQPVNMELAGEEPEDTPPAGGSPFPPPARKGNGKAEPEDDDKKVEARAPRTLPPPSPVVERELDHAQFVVDAAARVLQREITMIRGGRGKLGLSVRFARDPAEWQRRLVEFYDEHRAFVASTMHISAADAAAYAEAQLAAFRSGGVAVVTDEWETERTAALAFTALGEGY